MKTRESGMPAEEMWQSFFDPETILRKLCLSHDCRCVVDFGCGYGTFAIPAARLVRGSVHAVDLDLEMVALTATKAAKLANVKVWQRDFVDTGCGLPDAAADYAMLFNILHAAEAPRLLEEARRVLKVGGRLAVIHWNYDPNTPRGPSMEIRLRPEACREIVQAAGFAAAELVDLPPHHFGFVAVRL